MTRRRRFIDGLSLGYVYLGLVTLVGLWLTPFLLRHVGQHDLGLWMLATQVLGYIGLLDVGVIALLPREVAFATGRAGGHDSPELVELLGRVRRIIRWQLPMVALCGAGIWIALPDGWRGLEAPLAIVLAGYVALFPLRLYHSLLQGLQDLRFLGQLQLVSWAATTAITVMLVASGYGLGALVFGWVLMQAATAFASILRVRATHPSLWNAAATTVPWPTVKTYLKQSGWVSVSQIAQVFMSGTDALVIGWMLGPLAVVPYSCTGKLATVLANHPQLLMQAASPMLSELRAANHRGRLRDISLALSRAMLLLTGAVACVVIVVNRAFVSWWVGPALFGGGTLTLLLVVALALRHLNTTLVYSLFCFGHEQRISLTTMADGAVSVAASLVFVPLFGLIGAPIGSLVAVVVVSLPLNYMALARELETTPWTLLLGQVPFATRFVVVAAIAAAASVLLPGTWQGFAAGACGIAIVYAAVMAPLLFRPPLAEYVRWWWRHFGFGSKSPDPQVT